MRPTSTVKYFDIPAGTRESRCRSCDQPVYWITTATDRKMPVSIAPDGAYAPTDREAGQGISHFVDCPNAASHRKPR